MTPEKPPGVASCHPRQNAVLTFTCANGPLCRTPEEPQLGILGLDGHFRDVQLPRMLPRSNKKSQVGKLVGTCGDPT